MVPEMFAPEMIEDAVKIAKAALKDRLINNLLANNRAGGR